MGFGPGYKDRVMLRTLPLTRALVASGLVVASTLAVAGQGRPKPVVAALVETNGIHAGVPTRVALKVTLPEDLHVQANKPRDPLLIPTVLTITPPAGVTVTDITYPVAKDFQLQGQSTPLLVFDHEFVVGATVTVAASAAAGEISMPARLRYQACNSSTCFAPATEQAAWTLNVVPKATATPKQHADVFGALAKAR